MNALYPFFTWTIGVALGLVILWFAFGLLGLAMLYASVFAYARSGSFFSDVREHLGDWEFNRSAISLGPLSFALGAIFLAIFVYTKYSNWRNPA